MLLKGLLYKLIITCLRERILSKIFVTHLHTPFSTFVLNEKMAYSQKLLVHSKLSMMEIAIEAGFSSSSYFSDCFRRNTGMSPLQFRKEDGMVN
ncbi:MAG: helix-turn-helix transcriptional regulator [Lachnospiraceae bacterium]|nr:helix-turn-helix transcriptional regulator [Lachnospiraceae bacterium]